jgi:hypothetical protein
VCSYTQIRFYFIVIAIKIANKSRMMASCQLCCDEMLKIENPNMSRRPPRPAWNNATITRNTRRYCLKVLIYLLPRQTRKSLLGRRKQQQWRLRSRRCQHAGFVVGDNLHGHRDIQTILRKEPLLFICQVLLNA